MQSILAIDCGTLYTRAVLIDIVGDEYRFVGSSVAPTTTERPFGDITIGVNSAIAELEASTGRQFVIDGRIITPQRSDGHGIDVMVASCSAAPALRMVVAGLTRGYSTMAAAAAAKSTYSDVLEQISMDEQPVIDPDAIDTNAVPEGWWIETQAEKLLAISPDAVLIAGGIEGGPVGPLLRLGSLIMRTFAQQRATARSAPGANLDTEPPLPVVMFAGNSGALEGLKELLGDAAELVALPNLQPELGRLSPAPLQQALREEFETRQMPRLPGYEVLHTWSRVGLQPTLHAVELMTRYIAGQYKRDVLVADVGAAAVGLIYAGNSDTSNYATVIRGNFGMAQGIANLLAEVGTEAILRWLPFQLSAEELGDWAMNKVLRPLTLPYSARDLAIEHAFAREALRKAMADMRARSDKSPSYDLLVGTGGLLAGAPRNAQAALALLDGLEPTGEGVGSFELALDSTLLMPALGALAPLHPGAAAYVFDRDCLFMLGPCIVPLGAPPSANTVAATPARKGRKGAEPPTEEATPAPPTDGNAPIAVEITVDYVGGESQRFEVPYGTIRLIPLRPEQRASLRVKPGATFRIGNDDPGKLVQTRAGEEVKGGLLGLIVDARGRPLVLPQDDDARIAKLLEWGRALRAYSPRETFAPPAPVAMMDVHAPPQQSAAPRNAPDGVRKQTGPISIPEQLAPQPGAKKQTAPLLWPTGAPPAEGNTAGEDLVHNPRHLSTGRRPQTGQLTMPGEDKRK